MSFTISFVPFRPLCLLSLFLCQTIQDNAFEAGFTSPEQLRNPVLAVSPYVDYVPLTWKETVLDKPIIPISYDTFLRVWKLTLHASGFREILRPYSLRVGASGKLDGMIPSQ
jgi:hypothetical protein